VLFVDLKAEYESDLAALEKIYNRVNFALRILNPQKKQGRVKDYTLRTTIRVLSAIFDKYNQSNSGKKKVSLSR